MIFKNFVKKSCRIRNLMRTKNVPQRHVSRSVVQQIHSILVWDFTLNPLSSMLCLGQNPRNA